MDDIVFELASSACECGDTRLENLDGKRRLVSLSEMGILRVKISLSCSAQAVYQSSFIIVVLIKDHYKPLSAK